MLSRGLGLKHLKDLRICSLNRSNFRLFSILRRIPLVGEKIHNLFSPTPTPAITEAPSHLEVEEKARAQDILAEAKTNLIKLSGNVRKLDVVTPMNDDELAKLTENQLLQYAHHYYQQGDQEKALAAKAWKIAGERGNKDALYSYAGCLVAGVGIEKDRKQALEIFSSLALGSNHAFSHV